MTGGKVVGVVNTWLDTADWCPKESKDIESVNVLFESQNLLIEKLSLWKDIRWKRNIIKTVKKSALRNHVLPDVEVYRRSITQVLDITCEHSNLPYPGCLQKLIIFSTLFLKDSIEMIKQYWNWYDNFLLIQRFLWHTGSRIHFWSSKIPWDQYLD